MWFVRVNGQVNNNESKNQPKARFFFVLVFGLPSAPLLIRPLMTGEQRGERRRGEDLELVRLGVGGWGLGAEVKSAMMLHYPPPFVSLAHLFSDWSLKASVSLTEEMNSILGWRDCLS